jgi:hypothetical protein
VELDAAHVLVSRLAQAGVPSVTEVTPVDGASAEAVVEIDTQPFDRETLALVLQLARDHRFAMGNQPWLRIG